MKNHLSANAYQIFMKNPCPENGKNIYLERKYFYQTP